MVACGRPPFVLRRRHRRVLLKSPNHSPDLGSPFEADVVQVHELAAGHPTQIAKAVAGAELEPQRHRLEPDVVAGQAVGIIEPDIRLGGPIRAACTSSRITQPEVCSMPAGHPDYGRSRPSQRS